MLENEYFSIVRQLKTRYLERIKELEAEKEIGVKAFDKLQEDYFASEARIDGVKIQEIIDDRIRWVSADIRVSLGEAILQLLKGGK